VNDCNLIETYFYTQLRRNASKPAVIDADTEQVYSFHDLVNRLTGLARFLIQEIELKPGERVAFCARNGMYFLDALFAMPITGGILTTYNYMLRSEDLKEMVEKEQPRVLFYEPLFKDKIDSLRDSLSSTAFISLEQDPNFPTAELYEDIIAKYQSEELPHFINNDLNFESIIMLIHTGGTTGLPKAAKISYRALLYNALGQIITYGLNYADIGYISFPFFHCAAWNSALPLLLTGGKIVLKRKFDAKEALLMTAQYKLTFLAGSPTVFRRISECKEFYSTNFSSLRMIRCGSASPALDLMERYWRRNLTFYNGYGMTEAGSGILSLPARNMSLKQVRDKWNSCGMPMVFTEVKIVDEHGCKVPCGCEGELYIRGNLLFSGYWENEEETISSITNDGWFRSGDIARRDQDGFYYICGRKKNMFISGGENIYPTEIENILLTHPLIKDTCVIGVKDTQWGEVGKAIIVLHCDTVLSQEEVTDYIKGRISTIKIPKYITFSSEVPRSDSGKLLGGEIQALYGFQDNA